MPPLPPSSLPREDPLAPRPFLSVGSEGPPKDPGTRTTRRLAAFATLLLVLSIVALQYVGRTGELHTPNLEGVPPTDLQLMLVSRMAMGVEALIAASGESEVAGTNPGDIMAQVDVLTLEGSALDRMRGAIIAAEIQGVEEAQRRLDDAQETLRSASAEEDSPRTDAVDEDIDALRALYAAGSADAANLSQETRAGLVDHHQYLGEVALAFGLDDNAPARKRVLSAGMRTVVVLVTAFCVLGAALLVGFVLFIVMLIKMLSRPGIRCAYAPPAFGGSVYLETFALFLVGFLVVSVGASLIESFTGVSVEYGLIWILPFITLWPLLRGQPWTKHRFAMGWHSGRGVLREVGAGIIGYLALLPVFLFGVLCTLVLSVLFAYIERLLGGEAPGPMSHPIMEDLGGGNVKTLLVLLSLAALWAPLVEESIFRGAFFHHLRGRTRAVLAALLVGFVFAAIHPQGFAAIPALMGLGFSFALLREWRGSLIAPMTAHAMHNGFLITMLWLALG